MTRYSIQPRDQIFVKGNGFLSFAKTMNKNLGKNKSKNLSNKYSQKLLDHTKQSARNAHKTASTRAIQKTEEATIDLIGNKSADKFTKVSRSLLEKGSVTVKSETENIGFDREIPKERCISSEKRQTIIDDLRLI